MNERQAKSGVDAKLPFPRPNQVYKVNPALILPIPRGQELRLILKEMLHRLPSSASHLLPSGTNPPPESSRLKKQKSKPESVPVLNTLRSRVLHLSYNRHLICSLLLPSSPQLLECISKIADTVLAAQIRVPTASLFCGYQPVLQDLHCRVGKPPTCRTRRQQRKERCGRVARMCLLRS